MRSTIVAIVLLLAAPAAASEPSCRDLAARISAAFSDFPGIVAGTEKELLTWRASCAEVVPTGDGNVARLCEAETPDGAVFYWAKASDAGGVVGFARCA